MKKRTKVVADNPCDPRFIYPGEKVFPHRKDLAEKWYWLKNAKEYVDVTETPILFRCTINQEHSYLMTLPHAFAFHKDNAAKDCPVCRIGIEKNGMLFRMEEQELSESSPNNNQED